VEAIAFARILARIWAEPASGQIDIMSDSATAPNTRPSLLVRIRDGRDAEAWRVFVDVYTPVVYHFCRRSGLQDADAADVTQNVLSEVSRSIPSFQYQPEKGRFRDWLHALARRCLGRYWQRRAGREPGGEVLANPDPAAPEDAADWNAQIQSRLLKVALERIRPNFEPLTWQAFELSWLSNVGAAEVSARLEVSVEMVYVARSRVLKALRETILELAEDEPLVEKLR
jgi:RNA polymerase sigma factor (sigma-70 family)